MITNKEAVEIIRDQMLKDSRNNYILPSIQILQDPQTTGYIGQQIQQNLTTGLNWTEAVQSSSSVEDLLNTLPGILGFTAAETLSYALSCLCGLSVNTIKLDLRTPIKLINQKEE